MRKNATRPEQLVRLKKVFLRYISPLTKRALVIGNTRGRLACAIHRQAPYAQVVNISTDISDVQYARDRMRRADSNEKYLGARVSGLHQHREWLPQPYEVIVFHPHLQEGAGDDDRLLPSILRACTNLYEILEFRGHVVVLAVCPRGHLTWEYEGKLRQAFLSGCNALGMSVAHCSRNALRLNKHARDEQLHMSDEEADVFGSYTLIVAQKR